MWNLPHARMVHAQRSINLLKINWVIKFYISPNLFNIFFDKNNLKKSEHSDIVLINSNPNFQHNTIPKDHILNNNSFQNNGNSDVIGIRLLTNNKFNLKKYISNFLNLSYNDKLLKIFDKSVLTKSFNTPEFEALDPGVEYKIIVHYHGGAFIAMSSSVHQSIIIRISKEDMCN